MKKILVLSFAIVFAMNLAAQRGLSVGVRLIPQATGLLNKQDFDEGDGLNFEKTIGFAGGLAVGYGFSDNFGVMANLLYSKQGQNYINDLLDHQWSVELNYFKIPLLLRMNTDPEKKAMFVFEVGPELGFLMNASQSSDDNTNLNVDDYKRFVKSSDLSLDLHLGAGINFSEKLSADLLLRLNYGFSDITSDELYDYYETLNVDRDKTNNATAGFIIGLNYRL